MILIYVLRDIFCVVFRWGGFTKAQRKESDGKFAITTFTKVKQFEASANDRSTFAGICDSVGADGWLYSAPAGFAGWEYGKQATYVCDLFNLQPIAVAMPVTVNA